MGVPADGPRGEVAARASAPRKPAARRVQRPVPTGAQAAKTNRGMEERGPRRPCAATDHRRVARMGARGRQLSLGASARPQPAPLEQTVVQGWRREVPQHLGNQRLSPKRSTHLSERYGHRCAAVGFSRQAGSAAPRPGRQRRPGSHEDPGAVEYSDGAAATATSATRDRAEPGHPGRVSIATATGRHPTNVAPTGPHRMDTRGIVTRKGRDAAAGSVELGATGAWRNRARLRHRRGSTWSACDPPVFVGQSSRALRCNSDHAPGNAVTVRRGPRLGCS